MSHYEAALVLTLEASKKLIPNPFFTEPANERMGLVVYLYSGGEWGKAKGEVEAIMKFLDSLAEYDYFFTVVGEAAGDVEISGSPDLQGEFSLFPHWGLDTSEVGKLTGSNPELSRLQTSLIKAKADVEAAIDDYNANVQNLFTDLVLNQLNHYNETVAEIAEALEQSSIPFNSLYVECLNTPTSLKYPNFKAINQINELI